MRITTKTAITPIALSISLIHAAPISTTGNADDAKDVQVGFLEYFTNAMTGLMAGTEKEGEGEETPGEHWKHYGKQQKKYWKKVGKQYKKKYSPLAGSGAEDGDEDDEGDLVIIMLEDLADPVEAPGDHWKKVGKGYKKHWNKVGKHYKKKYTPPADSDDENVPGIVMDAENLI